MSGLLEKAGEYLSELDANGLIRERVHYFIGLYNSILPGAPLKDIFICDRIDEDGDRQFDSLWLLGDAMVAECRNVSIEARNEVWDLAALSQMKYISFESQLFNPEAIDSASRLKVQWNNDQNIGGILSATGSNCSHLMRVLQDYVLPRIPL